ncbi:uncharacterized protein EV422DRAFT_226179 [Fimicolochytrium jonesii]|uniref:uncharacterized protein n=1 Tax=Fimicolochytrium jonesii TaxID=1396493 RepID=UPI0022FE8429|nr:uncharacterized protein EV422DRAFT_226179 [Fimicolochytrium jonesii]KAI8817474.1 hypothetical protein EV422DRAFT_226179 [Fimicolochytrium jonesii]
MSDDTVMAASGPTTKHNAPPLELIPRILCRVALTSPQDYVNCLLVCKAWASALSTRERFLLKYNFQGAEEMPADGGEIYHVPTDESDHALDTAAYRMCRKVLVVYLASEFDFIRQMQFRLWECSDVAHSRHARTDTSQWVTLSADVSFLTGPLRIICTRLASTGARHPGRSYLDFGGGNEGDFLAPFMTAPVAEMDNLTDSREGETLLLNTLLSRFRVSKRIREYMGLRRISVADEAGTTGYLVDKLRWYCDVDYDSPTHADDHKRAKAVEFYQGLKNEDIVELIELDFAEGSNYDDELHGGWTGNTCCFVLCRRRVPRRNVLGYLMYANYNP